MPVTVIVGGFFGDEGKGKIISHLALKEEPAIAVRGGVGPNAGHTVVHEGREIRLRMLPSAVVNARIRLMLGAGVLVDPDVLLKEIEVLSVAGRVRVDNQCAIIEEIHRQRDRGGHLRQVIGTTGTGTGPANSDRVLRTAKMAQDVPRLSDMVGDVADEVNRTIDQGLGVLVEGTQGTFLSLYHGTYPYVTSKDVTASGICSDVGIGPKRIDEVVVVFKSYVTRVGEGPMTGQLTMEETQRRGWMEYGAVTGRPRRAAPFDMSLAKRAVMLNSATQVALTKLDVLYPKSKGRRRFENLDGEAKRFVESVEEGVGVPVTLIGTGPSAEEIIDRRGAI
ncbi:MAG: adenylosuccinate synthetase [Thaumarchaeota archaeon]|nr:adenylosuccinate synthetase [Nitrososphaerota archaeon]